MSRRPKIIKVDGFTAATEKEVPSMLVLSRREQETIVFPAIHTTIQLVKVRGQVVRIGIDAPDELKILRGEIAQDPTGRDEPEDNLFDQHRAARQEIHSLRNRLNEASVSAYVARQQIDHSKIDESRKAIQAVLDAIKASGPATDAAIARIRGERPRTLLVEDNANERHLMAGLLRASGFDVDVAGDGEEALSYLSGEFRPDVVLMDMMMPRCDGPTAVRRIRDTPSLEGLRIYAISGSTQHELGLETGPMGVDRWYSKPLDPDHLVDELTRELQGCRV